MLLVLFDIDGTLLDTRGAGRAAMGHAGRELYGPAFSEAAASYAGRLDSLIIRDLLHAHGHEPTSQAIDTFHAAYRKHLTTALDGTPSAAACPGVHRLLDRAEAEAAVRIGLLTGNFSDTGRIKLRNCGIDPARFRFNAWAEDATSSPPRRDDLPPVAARKLSDHAGVDVPYRSVVIIGDTPNDVACGRAHGCRTLAVCTGRSDADVLEAAGAELVLPDLTDTDEVLAWLLDGHA